MKKQTGKITLGTVLIFLLIFYGGFVVVKIITASLTKSQIKNAIIDKFGDVRGDDFTPEGGERIIRDILKEHGVLPPDNEAETGRGLKQPEIAVELDKKSSLIKFFAEYECEINLVLFKYKKLFTIEAEMRSYN